MYRFFILLIGLLICSSIYGQHSVYEQIQNKLESNTRLESIEIIETWERLEIDVIDSIPISEGFQMYLNYNQLQYIQSRQPDFIETSIITQEGEKTLLLQSVSLFAGLPLVKTQDQKTIQYKGGIHYQGIIKGERNSLVALSIFQGQMMGFISNHSNKWNIGKVKNQSTHIIFSDESYTESLSLDCQTPDNSVVYSPDYIFQSPSVKSTNKCVQVYIEIDYDIVQDKGSIESATDFIVGLFNQSFALYANEDITLKISEIKVWNNDSPYESLMASGMLGDFQQNLDEFNGDIAHLVSYQANGGIAAGFSGLCNQNPDMSMCYSSISSTYNSVPLYSWSVMVITHEMGHLLGSRHTHACVWNGDGSAIDGCAGYVEGNCELAGLPEDGGTIMSYCHGTDIGINFQNGFGLQPGNVIRNTVAQSFCLEDCSEPSESTCDDGVKNGQETGIDCGGPDCEPCEELCENIDILIKFDNYPKETTWDIKDENGNILTSGGPYGSEKKLATILFEKCLPFGCYSFTIYDSYGDGICCAYGNGFYKVYNEAGELLGEGSKFKSESGFDFCLNAPASCDDGVQNGDETGIDCGGENCPDCPDPTCEDGVQNGDETGIDCGGQHCPDCPTCDDGIQNGNETGIDCGTETCGPCTLEYCESRGKISFYEYIDKVVFGSFSNHSGNDNGYGNYTEMNFNFSVDESLEVILSPKHPYYSYTEYWRIWIDLNQDGDFEDENELRLEGKGKADLEGKLILPKNVIPGLTTMRVAMKYGSFPEPCEVFTFGEVEDYAVNIISGLNVIEANENIGQLTGRPPFLFSKNDHLYLFPTPVSDNLTVEFINHGNLQSKLSVLDVYGHVIDQKTIETFSLKQSIQINTKLYIPGVYLITIEQDGIIYTKKFIKIDS